MLPGMLLSQRIYIGGEIKRNRTSYWWTQLSQKGIEEWAFKLDAFRQLAKLIEKRKWMTPASKEE
jgi:hypothetical protein